MTSPARPLPRALRAAAFAVVTVGLATCAHVLGGGAVPPVPAVGGAALAVLAAAGALGGRERSFAAIGASTATVQAALHQGYAALAARPVGPDPSGLSLCHPPGAGRTAAHVAAVGHGGVPMLLAHLAAALAVARWLRRGEAALWALARLPRALARRLRGVAASALGGWSVPPEQARLALGCPLPRRLRARLLRHLLVLRGPPAPSPS